MTDHRRVSAIAAAALAALVLAGCAAPRATTPGPAQSTPSPSQARGTEDAVATLLARAERARDEGHDERAAASIERALRIRPADAALWHRLARLRLEQGRPEAAEQLAAKSISLAADADALRADNWRLIAEARRTLGDTGGAQAAQSRARALAGERATP